MTQRTVRVPEGTLVRFDGVGLQVRAGRNDPEFGSQPFVTINTEDLPPEFAHDGGMPIIDITLNDGSLYDDEGAGNKVSATVYVASPDDPVEDVAVFAREQDAEAFLATYGDSDKQPVRALVCDQTLAQRMIFERLDRDELLAEVEAEISRLDASGEPVPMGGFRNRAVEALAKRYGVNPYALDRFLREGDDV